MRGLLHSRALLPLIPPTPFSHKGRRGSLGILKLKTREGTQAPPQKTYPCKGFPPRLLCAVGGNPSATRGEARLRGLVRRRGEPLGYARRSPPARAEVTGRVSGLRPARRVLQGDGAPARAEVTGRVSGLRPARRVLQGDGAPARAEVTGRISGLRPASRALQGDGVPWGECRDCRQSAIRGKKGMY
jgi:hypothetical protein